MPSESKESKEGLTRIAIYMRLSPATSARKGDFKRQQEGLASYMARNPEQVLWDETQGQYVDHNATGAGFQRKAVKMMLADAAGHKFSKVVTYGMGRFARNLVQSVTTMDDLKALGVQYVDAETGLTYGRSISEDFCIKSMANMVEMEYLRSKKKTIEKMGILKKEYEAQGFKVGSPSIIDDWAESPFPTREGKKGLACKPNHQKKARFIQFWNDGIPRKAIAETFRRPVNPKCSHCKGNPKGFDSRHGKFDRKCACGNVPTLKTVDMLRVRLELPQRKPDAFGGARKHVPEDMLIKIPATA